MEADSKQNYNNNKIIIIIINKLKKDKLDIFFSYSIIIFFGYMMYTCYIGKDNTWVNLNVALFQSNYIISHLNYSFQDYDTIFKNFSINRNLNKKKLLNCTDLISTLSNFPFEYFYSNINWFS